MHGSRLKFQKPEFKPKKKIGKRQSGNATMLNDLRLRSHSWQWPHNVCGCIGGHVYVRACVYPYICVNILRSFSLLLVRCVCADVSLCLSPCMRVCVWTSWCVYAPLTDQYSEFFFFWLLITLDTFEHKKINTVWAHIVKEARQKEQQKYKNTYNSRAWANWIELSA